MRYRAIDKGIAVAGVLALVGCASTPNAPPPQRQAPATPDQAGSTTSPRAGASAGTHARNTHDNARDGGAAKAGGAAAPAAPKSERERALDRRFDRSLGHFDKRLAREHKELAREEEQADQAAASRGGSARASIAGDTASPSASAGASTQGGGGNIPRGAEQDRGSAGSRADIKHPPPDDIPDGTDDDVVAKQLREAAEQEDDPKLRAKLWKEYRQYKAQQ